MHIRLQAVKSNEISVGVVRNQNDLHIAGLLGTLLRNETIAIPKVEMHDVRLAATDFTIPLWMNRYVQVLRISTFILSALVIYLLKH